MPLETFDKIEDLVNTNPPGTDLRSQGDDHFRGVKQTLLNLQPYLNAGGLTQLGFPGVYGTSNDWTGNSGKVLAVKATEDGWEHRDVDDLIDPSNKVSDLHGWFPGLMPAAGGIVSAWIVRRQVTLPVGLTGAKARCLVAPSDGSPSFDLRKNGSSVGSVNFAVSANLATFTMALATTLDPTTDDYLTLHAPNPGDSTMADLMLVLPATWT